MSRFDVLETPVTLDVPIGILGDGGTQTFKTHKTGTNKTPNWHEMCIEHEFLNFL
jgi:hypothetical protein